MSKQAKYLILGAVVIGMVVLMFFWGSKKMVPIEKKEDKRNITKVDSAAYKRPINPSGSYLLYRLLSDFNKTASLTKIQTTHSKPLQSVLSKYSKNEYPNIYLSITEDFDMLYEDIEWLKDFVYEGNTALIAASSLPYDILTIFSSDYYNYHNYYDTAALLNFYHPELAFETSIELKNGDMNSHGFPKYKRWGYFNQSDILSNVIQVAYVSDPDFPVCLQVDYGQGSFLLHTLPAAFSNINMLKEEGKTHAEHVLSHLPKGNIHWHHDFGKYSPYRGVAQPSIAHDNDSNPRYSKSSPLQYILQVPALFAALVLLIVGVLLYMIFQSKRRQRIIPAIETNENSSMEFIETVGKLYFQQKRHDKLIKHKEQIFLSFIKHQYYLSSPQVTHDFIKRISEKSGIEEERVGAVFIAFDEGKSNPSTSDAALISLYNQLEYFYKNCN